MVTSGRTEVRPTADRRVRTVRPAESMASSRGNHGLFPRSPGQNGRKEPPGRGCDDGGDRGAPLQPGMTLATDLFTSGGPSECQRHQAAPRSRQRKERGAAVRGIIKADRGLHKLPQTAGQSAMQIFPAGSILARGTKSPSGGGVAKLPMQKPHVTKASELTYADGLGPGPPHKVPSQILAVRPPGPCGPPGEKRARVHATIWTAPSRAVRANACPETADRLGRGGPAGRRANAVRTAEKTSGHRRGPRICPLRSSVNEARLLLPMGWLRPAISRPGFAARGR
jgi:hypothetical protein